MLRLIVITTILIAGCTQPMVPDAGIDTGPRLDVGTMDAGESDAPLDGGSTDAGTPGALSVVGGFGTLPAASSGELTVVGGFGAAPACNGALCVYGGFSR